MLVLGCMSIGRFVRQNVRIAISTAMFPRILIKNNGLWRICLNFSAPLLTPPIAF